MNAKVYKSFNNLPRSEQQLLIDMMNEKVEERVEKENTATIEVMIKLMCIWLHDVFHFSVDDLWLFVGNWKNIFRWNDKMLKDDTQEEELDRRIKEIFGEQGFPQEFVDKLLQKGNKNG